MHFGRLGSGVAIVTGVASLSLVLPACGGASGGVADSKAPGSTAPRSTSTSAGNTQTAAVLQAYRAEWSAYDHALAKADAYDPALGTTMVDPLLQKVRATLLGYQYSGVVGRGAIDLHPRVTSLAGTTASVVDCAYSASILVYEKTGNQVPPVTQPENDEIQATLVLNGGVWKVSQQSVTEGKCSVAS
jgi:hypothetical protein